MPPPYRGACHCGAVTYEITGEPITFYVCHCQQCQKQSSSAFGMSLRVLAADFRLLSGRLGEQQYIADSGRQKTGTFCADCGSRIYHDSAMDAETINIKPGTLDQPEVFAPIGHIWTASKLPWVQVPADVLVYDGQPEHFQDLIEAWKTRRATETISPTKH